MKTFNTLWLLSFLTLFSTINAQTHQWTGNGGDNNWFNAANWDAGTVPDATSDVLISTGFSVDIITAPAITNSLTLQGIATLTIKNNLNLQGTFTIPSGSNLIWQKGIVSGGGTIDNNGLIQMESFDTKVIINLTIENHGAFYITESNIVQLDQNTVINNYPEAIIDISSNGGMIQNNIGNTINNEGLIRKSPISSGDPGIFYMIFDMNNSGIIEIDEDQTFLFLVSSANFNNLETGILRGEGTYDITATFTNNGTYAPGTASNIGTMEVVNAFSFTELATLEVDIAGTNPGEYDVLQIFGFPDLDGSISINLNFAPEINDEFTILTANDIVSCHLDEQIFASYEGLDYTFDVQCNDTDVTLRVSNISVLGIDDFTQSDLHFYVQPNPAQTELSFVFSSEISDALDTRILLYNALGQEMMEMKSFESENNTFQRGHLASGLYFAQLVTNQGVLATTKVILD